MRFRKRIKICKGLSINLSKSCTSFTLGGKGASINIGSKGTFVNTSIPGTGVYNRQKIGGQTTKKTSRSTSRPVEDNKTHVVVNLTINLDEVGMPIIKDKSGNIITDERILKQIKMQESYKEVVRKLIISRKEKIEESNCNFIDIYKQTPPLAELRSYETELNDLKFEEYVMEKFAKNELSIDKIRTEIECKAKNPLNKLFFWKREEYKDSDLNAVYQRKLNKWQEEKKAFEENERGKKEKEDFQRKEIYDQRRGELEEKIARPEEIIAKKMGEFLSNIVLPVEFSIDYQYYESNKSLYIDLDLPEIEDMPQKKATLSSNGRLSIKLKTAKQLKEDYVRCITGLAFYFAGNLFNISPEIANIIISGYTQRLSKRTGKIEDEYVYSVRFDKNRFKNLNINLIDPIEAVQNFENAMNMTSTYELKTIEPLAVIEIRE